jgi:hypothetical protein
MALLPLLDPGHFDYSRGRIQVETSGDVRGRSVFVGDPSSRLRILLGWDPAWVHNRTMDLILRGCEVAR